MDHLLRRQLLLRSVTLVGLSLTGLVTLRSAEPNYLFGSVAGQTNGPGMADGLGVLAAFSNPSSVAVDRSGNIYVADTGNQTIRKIRPDGAVTTLAGKPTVKGFADGIGADARFNAPNGVAVDSVGNVYVADNLNYAVRKISPAGAVTTVPVKSSLRPDALAIDANDNLFVLGGQQIYKRTPLGAVSLLAGSGAYGTSDGLGAAASFYGASGVAVDGSGTVYVTEGANHTVRKISPAGAVTTWIGKAGVSGENDGIGAVARFDYPVGIAADSSGNIFVSEQIVGAIRKITPSGTVTTVLGTSRSGGTSDGRGTAAHFNSPSGLALTPSGDLIIADTGNSMIRKATADLSVTTLAGSATQRGAVDGPASSAQFNSAAAMVLDPSGTLYVIESGNSMIRKITPDGSVSTFAGGPYNLGSADGTGRVAQFFYPRGLARAADGTLYVADTYNHTIRKITTGGVVTTLAGKALSNGTADGDSATARFDLPGAVEVDSTGNVWVADSQNNTIRKVSPSGVVTTVAGVAGVTGLNDGNGANARFDHPQALFFDPNGDLLIGDRKTVRRMKPTGTVTTIAGGLEWAAVAIAVSPAGTVYIAAGGALSRIQPDGSLIPVPGNSFYGNHTDGVGASSSFAGATGLAMSPDGKMFIAADVAIRVGVPVYNTGPTRLANLSVRSLSGANDRTLIVGFVVSGGGSKSILLRALGPTLTGLGVGGALADPRLRLFDSTSTLLDENDDWGGGSGLRDAAASLGAYPLSGTSKDAAMIRTVTSGTYSAHVAATGASSGVALAEIYDADSAGARLVNVSARSEARTGDDILIAGFVLNGTAPRTLLIRALGPTLGTLGVQNALADSQLKLFNAAGALVAENDNWGGLGDLRTASSYAGAYPLSETSKDAALLVTLNPGAYSAQVSGANATTGVALVEIYEIQ